MPLRMRDSRPHAKTKLPFLGSWALAPENDAARRAAPKAARKTARIISGPPVGGRQKKRSRPQSASPSRTRNSPQSLRKMETPRGRLSFKIGKQISCQVRAEGVPAALHPDARDVPQRSSRTRAGRAVGD